MTSARHPETGALILSPGDTIGVLGGGQLGRMLVRAASRLGLKAHVYCQETKEPAAQIAASVTCASWDEGRALDAFAACVQAVTYEFENVPEDTARRLEARTALRPGAGALAVAQDRLTEKTFLNGIGAITTAFERIDGPDDIAPALARLGAGPERPGVLKTRRMGYDGKGQTRITAASDAPPAWTRIGGAPAILEAFVPFRRELSVIVARDVSGRTAAYDVVENIHRDHILARTLAPAQLSPEASTRAKTMAQAIVTALDYVGVMGVELFETEDGDLLVNEIAPRVHNSGHWTLDACLISQFEQHIRAVAGWPLGSPERHCDAVMDNLIGADAARWPDILADGRTALHLYGKREMREGRKMGHTTRIYPLGRRPADLGDD